MDNIEEKIVDMDNNKLNVYYEEDKIFDVRNDTELKLFQDNIYINLSLEFTIN